MNTETPKDFGITYGARTFDLSGWPHATLMAMARRGVSHYLGSEQASKLLTRIEKGIVTVEGDAEATSARVKAFEAMDKGARKAAISTFRSDNPELIATWEAELEADAVKAMESGDVGTSVRGPALDPLTAIVNRLGKAEVVAVLKANDITIPKKADVKITTPGGEAYTMSELVERRKAHAEHGPRLVKEAKKVLADSERAAKKAAESGAADL